MNRSDRLAWIRYGVALLCVGSATAMRFAADPVLHDDHQFSTFYIAVIISAWFGGVGPALMATAVGGLIGHYCFIEPKFSFAFADVADVLRLALFVFISLTVSVFSGLLHQSLQRAQAYARQLERAEREKARLYEEARQANEAKDRFLAMVTHELRSPVNGILLWAKLLRSNTLDQSEREQAVDKITQCAKDQAQLVNDLLDTSSIVHGKMHAEMVPVDLAAIVESTVDGARADARTKQIELGVQAPSSALVRGDPIRLRQVTSNLLTNAIKFTPPHGHVNVGLTCENDTARLQVIDDGEGISPEYLARAFIRFSQGDGSLTRKHGGLGLGLSIVKDIVELHGGSVRAESGGPGRGATFTVTLPMLADAYGGETEILSSPPANRIVA
ncbi:MAG: domain S-box [Phycisphaerales bacterium]|nr:domain S-box [Phycisphaerales bacterium]